jgi:hypothetical protein
MAKGIIPSDRAWKRTAAAVRYVEGIPRGSQGAKRRKVFATKAGGGSNGVICYADSNATGKGKYMGYYEAPDITALFDATSDLTATVFAGSITANPCLILNLQETGGPGHDLLLGSTHCHPGTQIGVMADGTPVIAIRSHDWAPQTP